MPSLESLDMLQAAVLWANTANPTAYGQQKVAATGVQLKSPAGVRWVNRQREMMDPKGNSIVVDATVAVNQDIAIGSIMWLGTLINLAVPPTSGLMEVKAVATATDLKNRTKRREYGLMRYNDKLPTS